MAQTETKELKTYKKAKPLVNEIVFPNFKGGLLRKRFVANPQNPRFRLNKNVEDDWVQIAYDAPKGFGAKLTQCAKKSHYLKDAVFTVTPIMESDALTSNSIEISVTYPNQKKDKGRIGKTGYLG